MNLITKNVLIAILFTSLSITCYSQVDTLLAKRDSILANKSKYINKKFSVLLKDLKCEYSIDWPFMAGHRRKDSSYYKTEYIALYQGANEPYYEIRFTLKNKKPILLDLLRNKDYTQRTIFLSNYLKNEIIIDLSK